MPLRLDNAKSVAHMPTAEQQQTKKDFKPRFKVDPAASPMPETRQPERLAPRGDIKSEWWARSSESANKQLEHRVVKAIERSDAPLAQYRA